MFFSEEKNQKTFMSCPTPGSVFVTQTVQKESKVFCFFSSEKKTLLTYACRVAYSAACIRLRNFSFRKIAVTCAFTVLSEIESS
jgi:hypothetical protein